MYICNVFHPWDPGNLFRGGCCVRGRAGVELDARVLQLEHAESFNKWRGDAFCNEALARWLSEGGVRSVAVAGVYANACVQATVSGALKRGLQVTVLTDAVAAGSDGARRKGLENMQSAGARLSSVANWTTKDVS